MVGTPQLDTRNEPSFHQRVPVWAGSGGGEGGRRVGGRARVALWRWGRGGGGARPGGGLLRVAGASPLGWVGGVWAGGDAGAGVGRAPSGGEINPRRV